MADFSRYLPLSQRPPVDESGVSNDWRALTAGRLEGLVARATGPSTGTLTTSDAALLAVLADRLEATRMQRLARRVGVADGVAGASPDVDATLVRLSAVAAARRAGGGPNGIAELVEVVRTEARCHSLGPVPALDPMVAGSIALYALTRAPVSVRAAVAGRTLAPIDAPWRLGHGAELRTDTAAVLDFLLDDGPMPHEVA
ncbi:hypothetical protein P5G50_10805 [Leifsonia sp. F6_8S_P_1B]|uniref:Urease accessory protein n=1 Tax=Leifsonia williamsii TaxID=3035919 RepID=A0ABT8KBW0_9MICO|nr:hypothetical protein [Leifsonia williamsii]MDN4614940.1 hypothetical protein [Leifsonia williamsii]